MLCLCLTENLVAEAYLLQLNKKTFTLLGGIMKKYICDVCGYIYDPAEGDPENDVAPGTKWEDVPEDWVCPLCAVGKDEFSEYED